MQVRTLFVGSNWEALATLRTLINDPRFEIVGLITQPDKPVGRKQVVTPTEIKVFAQEQGIEVFHTEKDPEKYKQALELFNPELIVCKSFGEFLPDFFIETPKYKTINVHYSLLPKYRGAVPIQSAILHGEKVTGITIVRMVKKMDAGEILAQFEEKVRPDDTNQTLRERLVELTQKVLPNILEKWVKGEIKTEEQDESKVTLCYERDIAKEKAQIDWENMEPEYIERMVRAMQPWPIVWTLHKSKRVKVYQVSIVEDANSNHNPGELFEKDNNLYFATKDTDKLLQVHELQLEGKNKMTAEEFIRGRLV